jgi:internalin A
MINLTNLNWLSLSSNKIVAINLDGLTKLTILDLSNNQINDVKFLTSFTSLIKLDLTENQISNIKPLASLMKLNELILIKNPISEKICPIKPQYSCMFGN